MTQLESDILEVGVRMALAFYGENVITERREYVAQVTCRPILQAAAGGGR